MSHLNSGFDADFDNLVDLDQNAYTPSSATPDVKGKGVQSHRPSFSSTSSNTFGQPQQFSGPSFQYDNYRQQTGLPVGGLANTFALNQATGMQYNGGNHGFVMPTETLNVPLSTLDEFDFGRNPSMDMSDMDFENDSPSDAMPSMFYPSSSSSGQFVNPTALFGQDDSPTYSTPVQRMYPGMHTQQAAQAKAQQAAKQQAMLRQQQQPAQIQGQKPLPTPQKPAQKDPHVEESISRLLHQMRQNSVGSDDDAATPTGNMPNMARLKKEEEDMDEDERLLASEEGKKLSSKERRQLRNKVSARAFRSRRKEYIGQLEGEVAVKVQEANDLRVQNRQLMEENTRLTDLTRMLLSSQAFSGFLNELSQNGMPAPSALTAAAPAPPQPQPTRKDVNPHQAARQMQKHQPQVGMESNVDFSMMESNTSNSWNNMNSYQVCSVTEVPEGPPIDMNALSGKTTTPVTPATVPSKDYPVIESAPHFIQSAKPQHPVIVNEDVKLDENKFGLFIDQTSTATVILPSKSASTSLLVAKAPTNASSLDLLKIMCSVLDATSDRVSQLLP